MTVRGIIGKGPDRQVGGNHYNAMKIQPSRFARANDYDCDAFSILKYLSRHKAKKGREDVEKALSFVYIREDNREFNAGTRWNVIPIQDYLKANEFDAETRAAIFELHSWVLAEGSKYQDLGGTNLKIAIQKILDTQYPL